MKVWTTVIIAAVLGVVGGIGRNIIIQRQHADVFHPVRKVRQQIKEALDKVAGDLDGPRAEIVGDALHDFGTMLRYTDKEHTFQIKNSGNEPLTLKIIRTTCKCTFSELASNKLEPGEVTDVKLEWSAKKIGKTTSFAQTAEIGTNDPRHPVVELKVSGTVVDGVRAVPEELVIRGISGNDATEANFRIYSFGKQDPVVEEFELVESETKDYLDVVWTPMPKEEYENTPGATGGLLGTLKIKPGLPLGPLLQTLRIKVNQGEPHVIEMKVRGTVASDIILSGPRRFDGSLNLLNFGSIESSTGAKESVYLFVKGPHRDKTQLSIGACSPQKYLKATLGPPQPLGNGQTIKYKLTIEIPKGLPPENHLGTQYAKYGRVVIETTHPQTKSITLYSRFAVIP